MDPPQNGSSYRDKDESSSSMTRKRPRSNDDEAADDDESAPAATATTNQSSEYGNNATKIDAPNNKNTNNQSPSTSTTELKNDAVVVPPSQQQQQQPEPTPITVEGTMPQKKFYRSRAHCNPLSHNDTFDYPTNGPESMDWTVEHYPNHPLLLLRQNKEPSSSSSSSAGDGTSSKQETTTSSASSAVDKQKQELIRPNVLDIGCGFGGLTVKLSTLLPQSTILGLEIRAKVTEYVRLRIAALRKESPNQYQNCSVLRTNTMKYLPHYFPPQSIDKMFFCFPDPHFKRKNHCRRIVTTKLLTEYAYLLKKQTGRLYCITDVEELHIWHIEKCNSHPLFRKLTDEEMEMDSCVEAMVKETEEGKKVERAGSKKYYAVYERIDEEKEKMEVEDEVHGGNFFEEGQLGVTILTKKEEVKNEKKKKKGSGTKGKEKI